MMWYVDERMAPIVVDEAYRAPEGELLEGNNLERVARFLAGGRCNRAMRKKHKAGRSRLTQSKAHLDRSALQGLKPHPTD